MKTSLLVLIAALLAGETVHGAERAHSHLSDQAYTYEKEGQRVFTYNRQKPAGSPLAVESGGYFHPFTTPSGEIVTEVAPADHLHHRGIFLAFVEMHGKYDSDFWGWGEYAPKSNRKITSVKFDGLKTTVADDKRIVEFTAVNSWVANHESILKEELKAKVEMRKDANILHLDFTLVPLDDIRLAQWAFSGFCVRTRKDGKLVAEGPQGVVTLPNPIHTKPESDWPAASWYSFSSELTSGKKIGVAVINHPENPKTLWHNHRETRMINPCIVAPGEVNLKKDEPLRLRYVVVAWDGATPKELLNQLSAAQK